MKRVVEGQAGKRQCREKRVRRREEAGRGLDGMRRLGEEEGVERKEEKRVSWEGIDENKRSIRLNGIMNIFYIWLNPHL